MTLYQYFTNCTDYSIHCYYPILSSNFTSSLYLPLLFTHSLVHKSNWIKLNQFILFPFKTTFVCPLLVIFSNQSLKLLICFFFNTFFKFSFKFAGNSSNYYRVCRRNSWNKYFSKIIPNLLHISKKGISCPFHFLLFNKNIISFD